MSRNEFMILRLLSEQGPKKVTEFATILGVSASHITAVTDALVEKGWITRVRSKEDRRIIKMLEIIFRFLFFKISDNFFSRVCQMDFDDPSVFF